MRTSRAALACAALAAAALGTLTAVAGAGADDGRNFAGSVQLDYLAVPTERLARDQAFDGATVELSLKMTQDFGHDVTSAVKMCVACHGLEVGMAYFDLRFSDEATIRVGRFTPLFGSFPLRHDPANHRTSDKPLPYDMGRMLHLRDWGEGILPAPWVDNGVQLSGTHFLAHGQLDYAVYAVSGPKGPADGLDFDYTLSRSGERYYVDNNSQPSVGARLGASLEPGDATTITVGVSGMAGHYDPDARLGFAIAGADLVFRHGRRFLRAEYLGRWTQMSLGDDPAGRFKYGPGAGGTYDDFNRRDGFYVEGELPAGPVDLIARWDGLRRLGNVAATSTLRSDSVVLRYTLGAAILIRGGLRLKTSIEAYDFSDYDDELALHLGIAGPF
ncbi:MAG TPA: hypothetical protein VHE35_06625 [Kofleriaceae bacterium]|nr:hypothetical protein [Kofleriaceae bacterium]